MNQAPLSQRISGAGAQESSLALLCSTAPTTHTVPGQRETRAVKRLVRHRVTRQYLKDGGWTTEPLEGTVFTDSLDAIQACLRHGLTDVELALRIDTGTCDFFSTPLR